MAEKTLANPESQPSIDKAKLSLLNWNISKEEIVICLCKGFVSNGLFELSSVKNYTISGSDYNTIMNAMGDSSKQQKDQLEDAIWSWLQSNNYVSLV